LKIILKTIKNNPKNRKLTRSIIFNGVWSKLTPKTKLNHFLKKLIPIWDIKKS